MAVYVIDAGHGALKIVPRTGAVMPLGGPHGEPTHGIELSPDKHWLFTAFHKDGDTHYFLENTDTQREIALGGTKDGMFPVFGPDRIAVFEGAHGAAAVQIVDLAMARSAPLRWIRCAIREP